MSILITIAGTPIDFPSTGESPDWSPAVIAFAKAVESALVGLIGPDDISPQVQTFDASNPGTGVTINSLSFSTATVRSAFITYSVFRQTDSSKIAESGTMNIVYNPDQTVGSKWELIREYEGDARITFFISDAGQFSFTTTALAGTNHKAWLSFSAKALPQIQ